MTLSLIHILPKSYAKPQLTDAELTMAKTLINSMIRTFEPALYHDEYQARLRQLIQDKINGKEVVASKPEQQGNVIDPMEALQKSLEQTEVASGPQKKKPATRKKQGA